MSTSRLVTYLAFFFVLAGLVGWAAAGLRQPVIGSMEHATIPAVHEPIYPDASLYAGAYASAESTVTVGSIRGAIVNHHMLAAAFIADTLHVAAQQDVHRVILVSPNHFGTGQGWVQSTEEDWRVGGDTVQTDTDVVGSLAAEGLLTVDETPWQQEHGIYNIVPVIHHYFPQATLVPIIVKTGTPTEQIDQLALALGRWHDQSTLIVGSFDFAHGQTHRAAEAHDQLSLEALRTFDVNAVSSLDVDSPSGLRLVMLAMMGDRAKAFTLVDHSDASQIMQRPELTDVTSYITGVFTR